MNGFQKAEEKQEKKSSKKRWIILGGRKDSNKREFKYSGCFSQRLRFWYFFKECLRRLKKMA